MFSEKSPAAGIRDLIIKEIFFFNIFFINNDIHNTCSLYIIYIYITNKRTNVTISSMDLPQMILLETGVPVR